MTINDDFTNKAETEMKMHDAKMMELAQLKKIADATLGERILFALKKRNGDVNEALNYLTENHLIKQGESVNAEVIGKHLTT